MSGALWHTNKLESVVQQTPWLSYLKVSKLPHSIVLSFGFRKGDHKSTQSKPNDDIPLCLFLFAKSILEYIA